MPAESRGRTRNSLKGGPERVDGNYNCHSNLLQNFDGAPEEIGGILYSANNPAKSLRNIPLSKGYSLPDGFTLKDVKKELSRRELLKKLDPETANTFGGFIGEL